MKKSTLIFFSILVTLLSVFSAREAKATHCAGGQLTYVWVSDSTYKFTFKFYRDCTGTTVGTTFPLCYYSSCTAGTNQITMTQVGSPVPVVVPCPGSPLTTCEIGLSSTIQNYQEYTYEGTVPNLPKCANWKFYTYLGSRNYSYNTLTNQYFYVEANFNNLAAQGNSSPQFTVRPVPFPCINIPYTFNNGASDPNNDSLSFELVNPLANTGTCTNPTAAVGILTMPTYNLTNNPFNTNNTFVLNPTTGQLSFTANATGASTIAVLVKEWRGGVNIGSVLRDIQVNTKSGGCSQPPNIEPQSSSSTGIVFPTATNVPYQACAGLPFTLCTRITTPDTAAFLAVQSNYNLIAPASSMSYLGIGNDTVLACWSWTPTPNDTGLKILTFTVRDTNCLTTGGVASPQTFSVPVFINPRTVASNDTTICNGASAQLAVVGGANFTWIALPGGSGVGSLSCTNCNNPIATPLVTTTYVVQSGTTTFCNGGRDTVTVTIAPLPTFNAGPDTTTCINNSLQLNANVALPPGSYAISWTPSTFLNNANIQNPIVTPTSDISYVIRVVPGTAGACAIFDTIHVSVVQGYDIFNGDTALCKGQSIQIGGAGDSRYNYSWTPTVGVSNTSIINPLITPDTTRLYTITAKFPGCRDSVQKFNVDVQPIPVVYVGIDKTLCYGDTIHIDESTVTPNETLYPRYNFAWTATGGGFSPANTLHTIFQGFTTGTVKLEVSTPVGCKGSAEVTYTVIAPDFLTVSNDTSICPGDTAQLNVAGSFVSVKWSPNDYISTLTGTSPRVAPLTTTIYAVTGVDLNSCLDTQYVQVRVNPTAVISLPDSVTIFSGETYAINPNGNCLYFTWFPLAGLTNPNIANPVASPEVNTRYFVNAKTEAGCTVTDSIDVNVSLESWIDVPNAFSPGSQPNPIFKIEHRGNVTVKNFRVFNRWGAEMFSTTNVANGWDGSLNGSPQPMGVYVYIVEAVSPSGKKFYKQGNVTLLR